MKTNQLYLTYCLLFEERSKVLFKLPCCPSDEHDVKSFIDTIESFTRAKVMLMVLLSTRSFKSLLPLKDKIEDRPCLIHEGQCPCKLRYIGETKRKTKVCWRKHEDIDTTRKVLLVAPSYFRRRRILREFFIAIGKPALNDQLDHYCLSLFGHGIT